MSIYDLTIAPNQIEPSFVSNTGMFGNPLTGAAQRVGRAGFKRRFVYTYHDLYGANRAAMIALIAKLRGQENSLRVPVYDNPNRGAYGGTPLVDGANQTGNSIAVKGCSNGITNWIRAGDYFSIIVNGEPELKTCIADASSNGSGQIAALTFEPKLRFSPADSAAIYVEDGTLSVPKGIFVVDAQEVSYPAKRHSTGARSDFVLDMIEDLYATQP